MNLIVDNWCFVMEIECSLLLIFQAIFRINVLICSMLLTVQVNLCDQQGGLTGKPPWPPPDGKCGTSQCGLGGLREGGVLRRLSFKS